MAVVPVVAFWIKLAALTAALKVVVPVLVIESAPIAPLPPMMPVKVTSPEPVFTVKALAVVVLLIVEANVIALWAASAPPVESSTTALVNVTASL